MYMSTSSHIAIVQFSPHVHFYTIGGEFFFETLFMI